VIFPGTSLKFSGGKFEPARDFAGLAPRRPSTSLNDNFLDIDDFQHLSANCVYAGPPKSPGSQPTDMGGRDLQGLPNDLRHTPITHTSPIGTVIRMSTVAARSLPSASSESSRVISI